jgi:hypothetical protein
MVKLLPGIRAAGLLLSCSLLGACASGPRSDGADAPFDPARLEVSTSPAIPLAAVWTPRPDGTVAVAGTPSGYVATRASYTNYRLHVEWRWPGKPGNGGVLLHVTGGPRDGVWPLSQQVQTKHGFAGDLLPMAGAAFAEPLTSTPGRQSAPMPPPTASVRPENGTPWTSFARMAPSTWRSTA